MKIRVLIIDDEQPARDRLQNFLKDFSEINIIGEAQSGNEAIELINRKKPQLIFLDIQMSDINGFQVIEKINYLPEVIFVTAYDDYAIEAFEINAIDYLLKPYSKDRLRRSVERAIHSIKKSKEQNNDIQKLMDFFKQRNKYLDRITVKKEFEYNIIDVNKIDFFRIIDGLVYLFADTEKYQVDITLSQLEKKLDPSLFFRTHRNSIVNLSRISKVCTWGQNKYVIKFKSEEKVFLSRDKIKQFKVLMGIKF